jgi:hypothetical protein
VSARVYGYWVIRSNDDDAEVHRIAAHHSPGSSSFDRAEDGMYRKVDFDRFYIEFEAAP